MALNVDDLRRLIEIVTNAQRKRSAAIAKSSADPRPASDRTQTPFQAFSTTDGQKKAPVSA